MTGNDGDDRRHQATPASSEPRVRPGPRTLRSELARRLGLLARQPLEVLRPAEGGHRVWYFFFVFGVFWGGEGGGVACVFRSGPPDAEPFGVWLCWLASEGELVFVDLQNGAVRGSIGEAVALLGWDEAPREECFFAAFK